MKITIRKETILPMLEIFKSMKNRVFKKEQLRELMNHEDYLFELKRYNDRDKIIDTEEYLDNFEHLLDDDYNFSDHFKYRLPHFRFILEHIELFEKNYEVLKGITEEKVKKAIDKTLYGLPDETKIEEINIVFALGLGASGGWFYEQVSFLDAYLLLKDKNVLEAGILAIIAHENHHIGYEPFLTEEFLMSLPLEEAYYMFLSGEGLAMKYCNNYEGVLTKPVYDSEKNLVVIDYSNQYYHDHFDELYQKFRQDIKDIRENKYQNHNELIEMFYGFWMNPRSKNVKEGDLDDLEQTMNYFLGADIWGIIHDVLGRDTLIKTMKKPRLFLKHYNKALKKIGRKDLMI